MDGPSYRGTLAFNVTTLVAAQAVVKLVNTAVTILLVRYLGPQELGQYTYVLAFAYPFGALADFGLAAHAIREVSRDRSSEARMLVTLRRAALLLAVLGWGAMMAVAVVMHHHTAVLECLALAGGASILSACATPWLVQLSAREDLHLVSLHQVAGSMLGSLATVCVLLWGGATFQLLVASLLVNLALIIIARILAGQQVLGSNVPYAETVLAIRQSLPFGLLLLGFALYYRIDMVMLQWMRTAEEVGLYSAAYRFLDALLPLAAAIGRPFYPRFSHLHGHNSLEMRRLLDATWRPLFGLGLPLAIGISFVAEPLVRYVFGSEFASAAAMLRMLIWGAIPLLLVNIPLQALNAANRVLPLAAVYGVGLVLNVAANLVLIPIWGGQGASAATVLCEWFTLAIVTVMVTRTFSLWAARDVELPMQILVGLVTYLIGLISVGYLQSNDMQIVRRSWSWARG
jgi:O-antigen/teichoic acid export membrane protein